MALRSTLPSPSISGRKSPEASRPKPSRFTESFSGRLSKSSFPEVTAGSWAASAAPSPQPKPSMSPMRISSKRRSISVAPKPHRKSRYFG